jgi:hypothetical protein
VTTPDAESIAQLIDDCTDIPARLRTAHAEHPAPGVAAPWSVTEEHVAQLSDLDEFV